VGCNPEDGYIPITKQDFLLKHFVKKKSHFQGYGYKVVQNDCILP
jgi:hypothetical protein